MNTRTIPAVPCTMTVIDEGGENVPGGNAHTFDISGWLGQLDNDTLYDLRAAGWDYDLLDGLDTWDGLPDDAAATRDGAAAVGVDVYYTADSEAAEKWLAAVAADRDDTIGDCHRCGVPLFAGADQDRPVDLLGDGGCRYENLPVGYDGSTDHVLPPHPDALFPWGRCDRCGTGLTPDNDGTLYCTNTDECSRDEGDFGCTDCGLPAFHNGDGTTSHVYGDLHGDSFTLDSDHVALDPAGFPDHTGTGEQALIDRLVATVRDDPRFDRVRSFELDLRHLDDDFEADTALSVVVDPAGDFDQAEAEAVWEALDALVWTDPDAMVLHDLVADRLAEGGTITVMVHPDVPSTPLTATDDVDTVRTTHTVEVATLRFAVDTAAGDLVALVADDGWADDLAAHVDGRMRTVRHADVDGPFDATVAYNEGVDPDLPDGRFHRIAVFTDADVAEGWVADDKMLSSWGYASPQPADVDRDDVTVVDGRDRKDAVKVLATLLDVGRAEAANVLDGHDIPADPHHPHGSVVTGRNNRQTVWAAYVDGDRNAVLLLVKHLLAADPDTGWAWEADDGPGELHITVDGRRYRMAYGEDPDGISAAVNVHDLGDRIGVGVPPDCTDPLRIARKVRMVLSDGDR